VALVKLTSLAMQLGYRAIAHKFTLNLWDVIAMSMFSTELCI